MESELKEALKNIHLDHVAIAVNNLEESVSIYEALGLRFDPNRETVEEQKVTTAFAAIDNNAHLELLESTHEDGPIAKFIQKNGPGIHHLSFRVNNIEEKSNELKSKGFKLIYDSPRIGAGGCLVNFLHPKSTGGVLIEISQKGEN